MNSRVTPFLLLLTICATAAGQTQPQIKTAPPVIRSTLLCPTPDPATLLQLTISPDCRHIATILQNDHATQTLLLDGKPLASEPRFHGIAFSPDGNHLAYALHQGPTWCVVRDGKKGPGYDQLMMTSATSGLSFEREQVSFFYSPDSQHLAYAGRKGDQWFVIHDDQTSEPFSPQITDGSLLISFSPDSKHIIYEGINGRAWTETTASRCFIDDKLVKPNWIAPPQFTPDGRHYAYLTRPGSDPIPISRVLDGNIVGDPIYSHPNFPTLNESLDPVSINVRQTPAKPGADLEITIAGKSWPPIKAQPDERLDASVYLSPNSQRFALMLEKYTIIPNKMPLMKPRSFVLDGKEYTQYPGTLSDFTFSPDSQHFAWISLQKDHRALYREADQFIITAKNSSFVEFSPDSRHLLCSVLLAHQWHLLLDNQPLPPTLLAPFISRKIGENPQLDYHIVMDGDVGIPTGEPPTPKPERDPDPPPFHFNRDGTLTTLTTQNQNIYITTITP